MNYFDPETQAELNRERMREDIQAIRLQEKATRGRNLLSRTLASFGAWMVARGEMLRRENSAPQARYTELNKKSAHR